MAKKSSANLVEVAPAIPLPATSPQSYTYRVPARSMSVSLFSKVIIPFGKRLIPGIVVGQRRERVSYPTKELTVTPSAHLTAHQVALAAWIHDTLRGGWGYTLRLFYPATKPPGGEATPPPVPQSPSRQPHTPRQWAVIERQTAARLAKVWQVLSTEVVDGHQAVCIVPERWLLSVFKESLPVALARHTAFVEASLPGSAYTKIWHEVQQQKLKLIIGTQKAFFLPLVDLRVIVLWEEFYATHKLWDQYPRLDNALVARELAAIHQADLLYATSLSSLRLHHEINEGIVQQTTNHPLQPRVDVIASSYDDRRQHRLLPREAIAQLNRSLRAGETVAVLHNARGAWTTVLCRRCHHVVRCPRCHVALTVRGSGNARTLWCRHDQTKLPLLAACPQCHQGKLTTIGAGTEKLHEIFTEIFPQATLVRVERDGIVRSPATAKQAGTILIGTSALFRYLAGRRVDRAMYLFPERGLLYPDYRSAERTYYTVARLQQSLAPQRRVTLVTRRSRLVTDELALALPDFYRRQLRERRALGYPPYQEAVLLTVKSKTSSTARKKAAAVRVTLDHVRDSVTVRGPFASFIKQRRGQHELHFLLLGDLAKLRHAYARLPDVTIDVRPERIL